MAEILIAANDGTNSWVTTAEQIRDFLARGLINKTQAIMYQSDLMFKENEEGLAGETPLDFDQLLTTADTTALAVTMVDGWLADTTKGLPDLPAQHQAALGAQERGAALSPAGLRAAEPIVRRDVMRDFPGFAQATPIARAGMAPYGQAQDALVNFFANLAPTSPMSETTWGAAPTFANYLQGTQPTVSRLRANLGNVQRILGTDYGELGGAAAKGIHTSFQSPYYQLQAAIQPGLRSIAPALTQAYRSGAQQHQEDWTAMNPEQRFLDFAAKSGYF